MNLLSVFLVPAAYIYYMAGRPDSEKHFSRIAVLSGLVSGLCAIFVDRLFSPLLSLPVSNIFLHFLLIFISDTLIPLAVGVLPLWFISLSSVKQKIFSLRPQFFGIAAVYLPYKLFVFYNFPDVWSALFIPAMDISVLFLADFFLGRLLSRVSGTPDSVDLCFALLPAALGLVFADVFKTLWFFCFPFWTYGLLSFLFIILAFYLRIRKYYR